MSPGPEEMARRPGGGEASGEPAFTIVTKAHNEEALVGQAIRSALAQTRNDFELIVVDDGSTDRTADVVRGFTSDPRVRLLRQANRGVAAAMNAGIAAGRAPLVALLDADDLWMPTYLERMGDALRADPEAGFAYTDAWWLDEASGRFFKFTVSEYMDAPQRPPADPAAFLELLMRDNWMFGLATVRRSALQAVGGVDESLRGAEDYDLWIRLLLAGYRAVRVPGRLAVQRDRPRSLSASREGMLGSLHQVYAGVLGRDGVPERARRVAERRLREVDRDLAALGRGGRRARQQGRALLGRAAKRLLPWRYWLRDTPAEVAAAFPDLAGSGLRDGADPAAEPKVAVYGEFSYRRDAAGLSSDQSFAIFVAQLAGHVDRLAVVGRLEPEPGRTHHPLPDSFDFIALPDYPSLGRFGKALRATFASLPILWRTLAGVDAVWLLGPNPTGIAFALLARLRRRRVVLGVRQDIVALTRSRYGRGIHLAAAILLERAWRLIARGVTVVTVGTELEGRYAGARRVVPISVSLIGDDDLVDLAEAERRDYGGELVALSVGRLEPQKNPLLLADVLAELRRRDDRWRLVVCGEGSLQDELAARIRELGLAGHAELRGYVPVESGLGELYRKGHAFLHVSWTEGFPQVLLEAFAGGLPTVATAVGGIEAWAGEAALLVPPGDAEAAAKALQRLAGDPQLRRGLIEAGLRMAALHTADAECERVAAALRGG